MQACQSVAELVAKHGDPSHKVPQKDFEIWHYPLGVEAGMLYSIHVSVWPDGSRQTFLFFEPTNLPDSPPPDERWHRPAGVFALVVGLLLAYVAVYLPIHGAMHREPEAGLPMLSVCVPPLLYVGMMLTLLGSKGARILGVGKRESRMQLVVAVILAALGLLLWLWVTNVAMRNGQQA
jgi:hypothetical protein